MYRAFAFEGDVHRTLDCVPLAVRRKLDLAQLKISLEGWQALPRSERLALCHLPVDTPEDVAVYREVLQDFAQRAGVPLSELPHVSPEAWRTPYVPASVRARLNSLSHRLTDDAWRGLDDEERFSLVKMAEPKRAPWKLPALISELGFSDLAATPAIDGARCDAASPR